MWFVPYRMASRATRTFEVYNAMIVYTSLSEIRNLNLTSICVKEILKLANTYLSCCTSNII